MPVANESGDITHHCRAPDIISILEPRTMETIGMNADDCLPWYSVGVPSSSLWLYKPDRKATVEVFWQLILAMTMSRRGTCGL